MSTSAPSLVKALATLRLKESKLSMKTTRVLSAAGLQAGQSVQEPRAGGLPSSRWASKAFSKPPKRGGTCWSPATSCTAICCATSAWPLRKVPPFRAMARTEGPSGPGRRSSTPRLCTAVPWKANCRIRAALSFASCTSAAGSEPIVRPPPALTTARQDESWASASKVRMRMFHWPSPVRRSAKPKLPVQHRRGSFSKASMAAMVAVLGQPVMDPPGKTASRAAHTSLEGHKRPVTLLTMC
mmetsp:Transcript_53874/g.85778  ORF Transcript_53874/g.85778 Transcript_53874/m.85778 type:complete len:241 (-) Transcript_53874:1100-1822(-)